MNSIYHETRRVEVRCFREPWAGDFISVHVAKIHTVDGTQKVLEAPAIVWRELSGEDVCTARTPMVTLEPRDAQRFMDELWRVGIRPTEGAGSVGQLAATEKHLEDMRKIAMHWAMPEGTKKTERT